jgi:hypothetical protein
MTIEIHNGVAHGMDDYVYTALCSMPDTPRGEYDEEIDLIVRNTTHHNRRPSVAALKRAAQEECARGYETGLRVRRIVRVW